MRYVVLEWIAATKDREASYLPVKSSDETETFDTIEDAAARAGELTFQFGHNGRKFETAEENPEKVLTLLEPAAQLPPQTYVCEPPLPPTRVYTDPRHLAGPGLARLRASPDAEATRAAVVADQERAASAAAVRAEEEEVSVATRSRSSGRKKPPIEKKVAQKKPAEPRVSNLDLRQKVRWVGQGPKRDNPCRPGSGRHERYEVLRTNSGRTVEELLDMVPAATLRNASALGIIKMGR